jgi:Flp pilus assembly protein TadG
MERNQSNRFNCRLTQARLNRRHGAVLWYSIALMMAMCVFGSLAVDYGRTQVVKTELMRAADSAARAAVAEVPANIPNARKVAIDFAALNTADGSAVKITSDDIVFGTWDIKTKKFTPLAGSDQKNANAVQVTARRTVGTGNAVPLVLAAIYGQKSCDVTSTVIAHTMAASGGVGIIGLDFVTMNGNTRTDSYLSADGAYSPATARANGSVASNGSISLVGNAQILGSAYSPLTVNGGYIAGERKELSQPLVYPAPDAGAARTVNNDSSVAKYMSANKDFTINGNASVDFHTGVYFFRNFTATGGAVINANIDGPVTIYVSGDFTLTGGSDVYQGKAQNLKVVLLNPSTSVKLTGNTAIYADLYAPLSNVTYTGTADFFGQMVGKSLTLTGNAGIHYDESMTGSKHKIVTVK